MPLVQLPAQIKTNSKLDQVPQGCVQLRSEYFPYWNLRSTLGKNIFPYVWSEFPFAAACAHCLSLCTSGKNLDSICFIAPLRQLKAGRGSPPFTFFSQY